MHYVLPVQRANTHGAWIHRIYAPPVCAFASAAMRRWFHIGLLAVMMPLIIILRETWYWRCPLRVLRGRAPLSAACVSLCYILWVRLSVFVDKECICIKFKAKNILAKGVLVPHLTACSSRRRVAIRKLYREAHNVSKNCEQSLSWSKFKLLKWW